MGKANQKVVNHNQFSPEEFVAKWSKAQLSERAASHEHFIDLCRILDQPTPAEADATGADYCFEKHVRVVGSASMTPARRSGFILFMRVLMAIIISGDQR